MRLGQFAVLLSDLPECLDPVYPLELQRLPNLLTTDAFSAKVA
jgi:hypothetical protein